MTKVSALLLSAFNSAKLLLRRVPRNSRKTPRGVGHIKIYREKPKGPRPVVVLNAVEKFLEADYFLMLMRHVEITQRGCLDRLSEEARKEQKGGNEFTQRPAEEEFSYLLSACLNALYSATEYLRQVNLCRDAVREFREMHKHIYGSGITGGWRTKVTHFHPVWPISGGEKPKPYNEERERFWDQLDEWDSEESEDVLIEEPSKPKSRVVIEWIATGPPDKKFFYFNDTDPQETVIDLLQSHLLEVGALMGMCEEMIRIAYPPPSEPDLNS